jgi:phospholipid/cholesterol/gamma-HCH transport system substrate-binding protein
MTKEQRWRAVGLVLFMAASFAIGSVYFAQAGTNLLPGSSPNYTAQAVVPTAVALAPDADVREAGVNIGTVDSIASSGPVGAASLVKFELDSHAPLYRDAKVYVRTKSVAGENYIELDPGTPAAGALPSGGMLGIDRAQDATQIDEILSIFDHARQRDLQRALYGLAGGVQNGGKDLNRTLEAASALPGQGSSAAAILAGDRTQFASLVDTLGTVTHALGSRQASIRLLTRQIKVAAQAVAARDTQLRAVLAKLPPFLVQAQGTAGRLQRFAFDATPVIHNLRLAAQDLVPAVQVLTPAARRGTATVAALRSFALAATPALRRLKPFAVNASAFVPPLESLLRPARPLVTYLAPYVREIGSFFGLDAASLAPHDSTGHVGRIILPISLSNLAGVLTPQEEALVRRLEGSFDTRGQNAYPAPGGVAANQPYAGSYPHLTPDPPYGK